jgi:dolichol-phosphate mannosyltransferase
MKTAIIIPLHNEEGNIKELLDRLLKLKDDLYILPVDDNSSDKTKEIINYYGQINKNIIPLHRDRQEGLHAVYITGFKKAIELPIRGIITMDGDLSHSPEDVPRLISKGVSYDLVIGSRYVEKGKTIEWSPFRKLMSWTARSLARLLLGIKVKDCTAGFKYYSKELISSIDLNNLSAIGYAFQVEMVYLATKNNFTIKEIPITFRGRKRGSSKVDNKETFRFLRSVFKLFIS